MDTVQQAAFYKWLLYCQQSFPARILGKSTFQYLVITGQSPEDQLQAMGLLGSPAEMLTTAVSLVLVMQSTQCTPICVSFRHISL